MNPSNQQINASSRIATFEASAEIASSGANVAAEPASQATSERKFAKIYFRPAYSGGFLDLDKSIWPYPTVFDVSGIERADVLPILRDHKNENAVGQTTKIDYRDGSIDADGEIVYAGVNPAADAVLAAWRNGARLQASVRTGLIDAENIEFVDENETAEANGRSFKGPCEIVRKLKLREISIVTVGADDQTSVEIRAALGSARPQKEKRQMKSTVWNKLTSALGLKSGASLAVVKSAIARAAAAEIAEKPKEAAAEEGGNGGLDPEQKSAACAAGTFEEYLAALGLDQSKLSEAEINVLRLAFDASRTAAAENDETDANKTAAAENDETDANKTAAAEDDETDANKTAAAEDDETDAKTASASFVGLGAFYGARRPASAQKIRNRSYQSFRGAGLSGAPHVCRVAEAALMTSAGIGEDSLKSAGFNADEIDAATSGAFARLSMKGLLYRSGVASVSDYNDPDAIGRNLSEAFRRSRALPGYSPTRYRTAQAAGSVSAIDAPNVFANVMHKAMLVGQKSVDDPTNKLSKVVSANDFRPMLFYDLLLSGDFADVKDNGELENLKASDKGYTNAAELKGFEFRIRYQDLVNDNTNALVDVPNRMGRKAMIRKQRLWWQKLAESFSAFTAVSGNPAFDLTGLSKAVATLKSAKDSDGDPIGIGGKYLLVPPTLEDAALEIQHATSVVAAGGGNKTVVRANANNLTGRFETIASEFVGSDGPASAWGDSAYMLIADPADLPTMIISYLHGSQGPTLKSVNGDYEIEGLKIGCWWGFGISLGEPKGGVYSSGSGT